MKCTKCGKEFESLTGHDTCSACRSADELNPRPLVTEASGFWESAGPFFPRLWDTWKTVMFSPTMFFRKIPIANGIIQPLIYAIIMGSLGLVCAAFWQMLSSMLQISFFPKMPNTPGGGSLIPMLTLGMFIGYTILSPVIMLISQFVWSGILHLCLMILGGNKKGFEATFRVVAYGASSPMVFGIIPFCGGLIGYVWSTVLQIIGLRETHQISTGKAVIACFLPLIVCCGCGFVLVLVFGTAIFAAVGSSMMRIR